MSSLALSFNEVNFSPVAQNGQIWLTAPELASALGYSKSDAVGQIYERNKDEFNSSMTTTITVKSNDSVETLNLSVSKKSKNLTKTIRIFSLRGAHLIAMFAKTEVAKQFRKWVLDLLDKEVGQPQITSIEDLLNASLEQGKTATEICNQVTKAENISFGMGRLHGKGLSKRKKEKKILKELQAITLKWMQFKLPFVESKAV